MILFILIPLILTTITINPSTPSEYKLEEGIQAFYGGEWDKATEIFDTLISTEEENAKPFFFRSMIPFWKYFFGGQQKEDAREYLNWSERAIKKAEKGLKTSPNDTSLVLLLSGLHGYRALVAADLKEYRVALKSGLTGFTYTRQMLQLDELSEDALIGKGVYYYMTGSIPKEVRWFSGMMGISGSKEKGFQELEKAAQSDSFARIDANMILCYLYLREDNPEDAYQSINRILPLYDSNPIFNYYKAKALDQLEKPEEAIFYYRKVADIADEKLDVLRKNAQERIEFLATNE